jgi:hypothetical protein
MDRYKEISVKFMHVENIFPLPFRSNSKKCFEAGFSDF